jgi:hypothetical protein
VRVPNTRARRAYNNTCCMCHQLHLLCPTQRAHCAFQHTHTTSRDRTQCRWLARRSSVRPSNKTQSSHTGWQIMSLTSPINDVTSPTSTECLVILLDTLSSSVSQEAERAHSYKATERASFIRQGIVHHNAVQTSALLRLPNRLGVHETLDPHR